MSRLDQMFDDENYTGKCMETESKHIPLFTQPYTDQWWPGTERNIEKTISSIKIGWGYENDLKC